MAVRTARPRRARPTGTIAPQEALSRLLTVRVADVHVRASLTEKLRAGRPLRIKLGADPTAPDLHLGHAVALWKLREFQDLGHTVVLIVGDVTAQIGDPSGKTKMRPQLSVTEVQRNARTYVAQVKTILDPGKLEIHSNSEWFGEMSCLDLVRLASHFTVARLIERDDFRDRLKTGRDFVLSELLYPVLQAYDSVAMHVDVEVGGTDQLFNMLAARDLQRKLGKPEQDVITLPLLVGTDGKEKMSKSLGNVISLLDSPAEMFGKLMTIPDAVVREYARLAARYSDAHIRALEQRLMSGENPRDVKADVAEAIVVLTHGTGDARRAREEWRRVVQEGGLPANASALTLRAGPWNVVELLVATSLARSKSEARRLIRQGGVHHNGTRVPSDTVSLTIARGDILHVGKRRFVKIT